MVSKGKEDTLPTVREIRYLACRKFEITEVQKDEEGKVMKNDQGETLYKVLSSEERMKKLFVLYWDILLPKVAGDWRWGSSARTQGTILESVGDQVQEKQLITDGDEAFLVAIWENYFVRWTFSTQKKKELNVKILDPKTLDAEEKKKLVTKYTDSKMGNSRMGGWTKEGQERFYKLEQMIATNKRPENVEAAAKVKAAEVECLKAVRQEHGWTDESAQKQKKKKAAKADENDVVLPGYNPFRMTW